MSDLISRKYLYNLMCEREETARNRVLEAPTGSPKFGSCCARLTEITALKHDIADAPTVEAKPVVRGKWIEGHLWDSEDSLKGYRCSNCNDFHESRFPFCPHCGSYMWEVEVWWA